MRLLLDANLSPKRIGSPLKERGHDVLSLASDAALGALDHPDVLKLAAETRPDPRHPDSRDFEPLLREWAEADSHHAGCILNLDAGSPRVRSHNQRCRGAAKRPS